MRTITEDALNDLPGTQVGCGIEVSAWYDGRYFMDLPVESWSITWVADRDVQGIASLDAPGVDSADLPWRYSHPLNVGGGRLKIDYRHGLRGEHTRLGVWANAESKPAEAWHIPTVLDDQGRPVGFAHPSKWQPDTGSISLEAGDLFKVALKSEFETVEAPKAATVIAEIRRLMDGIAPIGTTTGVVDKPVPAGITYNSSRPKAVQTMAALVGAFPRMSEYGCLDLVPTAPTDPVWTIRPGVDGTMINLDRAFSMDEIVNGVAATGRTEDNDPLVGYAHEADGDLRWGGPAGKHPTKIQSTQTTQAGVDSDARTHLQEIQRARIRPVEITCPPNPALEIGDYVAAELPIGNLVGPIREMGLSGSAAGVDPMTLTLAIPLTDLMVVAENLQRMRRQ